MKGELMFNRKRKPEGRTPSDLPPRYWWARDEMVDLRLRVHDLTIENMKLRMELAEAPGSQPVRADAHGPWLRNRGEAVAVTTEDRADQLARYQGFPKPVAELKGRRIWKLTDVEKWQKERKP